MTASGAPLSCALPSVKVVSLDEDRSRIMLQRWVQAISGLELCNKQGHIQFTEDYSSCETQPLELILIVVLWPCSLCLITEVFIKPVLKYVEG
jgi:hypothetical protein